MIDQYDMKTIQPVKLRKYMTSYLDIMMTVSSIMLIRSGTEESLAKKKDLWQYLKNKTQVFTINYISASSAAL